MKYRVHAGCSVDLDNGRVRGSFAAGDHAPKDEAEREAFEHLVAVGLAERVKPTSKEAVSAAQ